MGEMRPDSSQRNWPELTKLMRGGFDVSQLTTILICANIAIFVAMLQQGAALWHTPNGLQLAWGASFGPATKDDEWYRLASAMFIHFGLLHLAMNMWALWDVGRFVERLYGPVRFGLVYVVSGVTGNLLSLYVHGDQAVSGGASGAIFGLYGALLIFLWRERRQVNPVEFKWLFGGAIFFSALVIGLGLMAAGIDNAAHVGGLAAGALIGRTVVRPMTVRSPNPGHGSWLAFVFLVIATVTLIFTMPAPTYRWSEELQAREGIRDFLSNDQRILERWQSIVATGFREGASFDEVAQRIDSDIAQGYQDSFEQLSTLNLVTAAPSAFDLEKLKTYARLRAAAAHSLAEGLRSKDEKKIRDALEKVRRAPEQAHGIKQN